MFSTKRSTKYSQSQQVRIAYKPQKNIFIASNMRFLDIITSDASVFALNSALLFIYKVFKHFIKAYLEAQTSALI